MLAAALYSLPMKKMLCKRLAICMLLLCLIAGTAVTYFIPSVLESQIKTAFRGLGFNHVRISNIAINTSSAVFSDIKLDQDGFSTLEKMALTFNWGTLAAKQKLENIHFEGMTLTAILESDGTFSLSGWGSPGFGPFGIPAETISFNGIKLDVDTIHGALRFEAEGKGVSDDKGNIDLQALIKGEQNQIQLNSSLNGRLSANGSWDMEIRINEGRLNLTDIAGSRLGGWMSLGMKYPDDPIQIGGQLHAGLLKFGPVPLQNVTATLKGCSEDYNIIVNGTGGGAKNLIFNVEFGRGSKGFYGQAAIKSRSPRDIADFAKAAGIIGKKKYPPYLSLLSPMNFDISYIEGKEPGKMQHLLSFDLYDESRALEISGTTKLDFRKKTVSGSLKMARTKLKEIAGIFPFEELTGMEIKAGTANIEGRYFLDLKQKTPELEGPLTFAISDISLKTPGLAIYNAGGNINLDTIYPPKTGKPQRIGIDEIRTGTSIYNASAEFELLPQGIINISHTHAEFAGGILSLEPLTIDSKSGIPSSFTIIAEKINIRRLVEMAKLQKDLEVKGDLHGKLGIDMSSGEPVIKEGFLSSGKSGGWIYYKPDSYPGFLEGTNERLEIVRKTVSHFEYDEMSLSFSGPVYGELKARLKAKGKNQIFFGDRPVHLDIKMDGEIPFLYRGNSRIKTNP